MYYQELWEKWRGHNYTILCSHHFVKFPVGTCLKKKNSCLNNKKKVRWNHQSHIDVNAPASFTNDVCVCGQLLSHAWLFVTPCTVAHQAPLSTEFFRQESWSKLTFPTPEDLPDPGIEPTSPVSPALLGRFFTTELSGKPLQVMSISQNKKATQPLTLLLFVARKYRDAGPKVIFTCKWAWKD